MSVLRPNRVLLRELVGSFAFLHFLRPCMPRLLPRVEGGNLRARRKNHGVKSHRAHKLWLAGLERSTWHRLRSKKLVHSLKSLVETEPCRGWQSSLNPPGVLVEGCVGLAGGVATGTDGLGVLRPRMVISSTGVVVLMVPISVWAGVTSCHLSWANYNACSHLFWVGRVRRVRVLRRAAMEWGGYSTNR